MRPGAVVAVVALALSLSGCQTFDERAGHRCGDSPDAVCPEDSGAPVEETVTEQAEDDVGVDCAGTADADFPAVVDVELERTGDSEFRVSATLCSAYDTAERYADAWRVTTPEGEVLGVRELLHDHAGEQPFTRSLGEPVTVPDGVESLVVEGRDLANGWGGATLEVSVPEE